MNYCFDCKKGVESQYLKKEAVETALTLSKGNIARARELLKLPGGQLVWFLFLFELAPSVHGPLYYKNYKYPIPWRTSHARKNESLSCPVHSISPLI